MARHLFSTGRANDRFRSHSRRARRSPGRRRYPGWGWPAAAAGLAALLGGALAWRLAHRAPAPLLRPATGPGTPAIHGWAVVDELDLGDAASESRHAWRAVRLPMRAPTVPAVMPDATSASPLTDNGRFATGEESCVMVAAAGVPVILLARLYAPGGAALAVSWNAGPAVAVPVGAVPGRFQTILLAQAAGESVLARNHITITPWRGDVRGRTACHFWALQPVTVSSTGTH